jgi:DNA modification methylase
MLEENKIHLGDCLNLMPSIPSKSVDMILCDLPYGTTACEWDSIIDMTRLWHEYERVIKDNGAIVFHLGDCLNLMPSIPSKSVDMILCDLPYGTTACEWDSIIDMN